ncbi:MAG: LysM peptidoglycan-binding domain-containing protein [Chthoniobacterales bacterium]
MKPLFTLSLALAFATTIFCREAVGQTFAAGSDKAATELEALSKKIDEQNIKIDLLSQQILKLDKEISGMRPGVMIGEGTPSAAASSTAAAAPAATNAPNGSSHVVAKGETLTSIAKMHHVGVQELQKFNHIENDRALQIGQTIMIPAPGGASPSPSASPNE